MKYRLVTLGLVALACHFVAGCKSVNLINTDIKETKNNAPWWKKDDLPPVERPAKIVAIWANSVFNEPGMGPTRGLGGRVYFYNAKHKPVRVDGELTVFLYDDTSEGDREKQEATRRVTFSADEVAEKYTPTEFGPSYSFWLPWDTVGGERAQLSIIPVFNGKSGEMLVGEQARYLLPGKSPAVVGEHEQEGVIPASFEDQNKVSNALQLNSSTIKLPPSMQRRVRRKTTLARQQNGSSTQRNILRSANSLNTTTESGRDSSLQRQQQKSNKLEQRRRASVSTFGRRPGVVHMGEVAKPELVENPTNALTQRPSIDSQRDRLRAQTLQSAPQASAPDPSLLDRAKLLFGRSP